MIKNKEFMNIFNNKQHSNFLVIGVLTLLLCFSCEETSLVETYDEYIPEKVVSLGTPDFVSTTSGYETLTFNVYINSDPKISKIVVATFDDNEDDDDDKVVGTLDVNRTVFQPEMYQLDVQLPEGENEYFVHLEDSEGNESVAYDVFGVVYGEEYRQTLTVRSQLDLRPYSDTEAIIFWDTVADDSLLISTEIRYVDSNGTEQTITVANEDALTLIPDAVSEGSFYVKSTYLFSEESTQTLDTDEVEYTFPVI